MTPTHVHDYVVMAFDREDGSVVWQKTAASLVPHAGTHPDGTFASASAVTDGDQIYAYFGSVGLFVYDMDGGLNWKKDLGDMRTRNSFGEGSTPAVHRDTVVINWDHEDQSFLIALDKMNGDEKWRVDRPEATTWGTPLIVEANGKTQVIVNATTIRGYDFEDGSLLWECRGGTLNAVPTPIYSDGKVFVTSGFRGAALHAIDVSKARGDVSESAAVLWSAARNTPYVPSPALHDGVLYVLKENSGILTAFDPATGDILFGPERLDEVPNVYASIVGAADRIYVVGREGSTLVLEAGESLERIAVNSLDEGCDASPAIADDEIYLRGSEHLYCIAEN